MENEALDRIILGALVFLFVMVAGAQAYRAGEKVGRQLAYSQGYTDACAWAERSYATKENDEVLALCMESIPDGQ